MGTGTGTVPGTGIAVGAGAAAGASTATGTSTGPGCERDDDGVLVEPVSAVTSAAFVVAALVVLVRARRADVPGPPLTYVVLVAGIGVGSFVQHGPDPAWSDPAHDLPLLATLCFLAADGVAALTGRERRWWWWAAPTAVLMVPVVLWPRPGDLAQVAVTVIAGALLLARAAREPRARRRVGVALVLLAVGGAVGTLGRTGGPLCDPDSLWQGHAVWHLASATALAVLAPLVTRRTT